MSLATAVVESGELKVENYKENQLSTLHFQLSTNSARC
jgi:hypothetical protein